MTKANIDFQQDDEMLDEYDFSQGVRGKYYQQYYQNNLKNLEGVQFLVDGQGRKTGVMLDFQIHQVRLQEILNDFAHLPHWQYLVDFQGKKIAVVLNFKEHLEIWQIFYDRLVTNLLESSEGFSPHHQS